MLCWVYVEAFIGCVLVSNSYFKGAYHDLMYGIHHMKAQYIVIEYTVFILRQKWEVRGGMRGAELSVSAPASGMVRWTCRPCVVLSDGAKYSGGLYS